MTAFLSTQLDFIFFFYGLAFILMGGVCFAVSGISAPRSFFGLLGSFALVHGIGEWLDLIALLAGDAPPFAAARTALMSLSFLLLLEFARRHAIKRGLRVPGPWLHATLLLLVGVSGAVGGTNTANAVARYAIGFVGAMATAWVLLQHAKEPRRGGDRWWKFAAAGFVLYGVAAGVIVPAAPIWPASFLNSAWFMDLTGIPIQLVRGLIACWITAAVWVIWKHMVAENVDSARYTASQQRILVWTLLAAAAILASGWYLTEFLGGIYKRSVQEESTGDIRLLAGLLDREADLLDRSAKAAAGSTPVQALLTNADGGNAAAAQAALDLSVAASGAKLGYLLKGARTVVVSSGGLTAAAPAAAPAADPESGADDPRFAFDAANGGLDFHGSAVILARDGTIAGRVLLIKASDGFETALRGFNRPYFLIDPTGLVRATNRPEFLARPLWPQAQPAPPNEHTMLEREVSDGSWRSIGGERHWVRRQFAEHSRWSLVLVMPNSLILANRFLGIIITLLVSIMMMIYLYGRERSIRDHVELESRLNLREVAQGLQLQATTDPLTGLYNRLKFNEALRRELARAQRHRTPLSVVLFDVDHFKAVNDTHGHPIGDAVLVRMAELLSSHTRPTDLLARWGGEEFIILAPGSTGKMAQRAAERLRVAIQRVVFAPAGRLSCSFGIAEYAQGDTDELVIARADAALYRAKIGGRNRVEVAS